MVKQCHKSPMAGNGKHTTYINGDDWGMVNMALFYPQRETSRSPKKMFQPGYAIFLAEDTVGTNRPLGFFRTFRGQSFGASLEFPKYMIRLMWL